MANTPKKTHDTESPKNALEQLLNCGGLNEAIHRAAYKRAQSLGMKNPDAIRNVLGNVSQAIGGFASLYQQGDINRTEFIEFLTEKVTQSIPERAEFLKIPQVRNISGGARYPEGAIAFYDQNYRTFASDKGGPPTVDNGYGQPLTANDMENALISDLNKTAAIAVAEELGMQKSLTQSLKANVRG